jgi:hypothetical protein
MKKASCDLHREDVALASWQDELGQDDGPARAVGLHGAHGGGELKGFGLRRVRREDGEAARRVTAWQRQVLRHEEAPLASTAAAAAGRVLVEAAGAEERATGRVAGGAGAVLPDDFLAGHGAPLEEGPARLVAARHLTHVALRVALVIGAGVAVGRQQTRLNTRWSLDYGSQEHGALSLRPHPRTH